MAIVLATAESLPQTQRSGGRQDHAASQSGWTSSRTVTQSSLMQSSFRSARRSRPRTPEWHSTNPKRVFDFLRGALRSAGSSECRRQRSTCLWSG